MPAWLPLAVTSALYLVGQAAVLLIWGANLSARVRVLEREANGAKKVSDKVIELGVQMTGVAEDVSEIKGLLEGLRGPPRPRS